MNVRALVGVAGACAVCACHVPDDGPAPRPFGADLVDDAAPDAANSTTDAGAVSSADAASDGPYPGVYPDVYSDVNDASAAPPAYVLSPDTVLDPRTHLMWQRNEPNHFFGNGVPEVTNYCQGLGLAGFNDWRPATVAELKTLLIVHPECPLLDLDAFPNALCDWYISSEALNGDPADAMMVDFATGATSSVKQVSYVQDYSTRCVRTSP